MNVKFLGCGPIRALWLASLIACVLSTQIANATIITSWTFESPNTPADATAAVYPNLIAPAVGTGNAGGAHVSAASVWSTPVGNGSTESFSSNNWAVGDYYEFQTNTLLFNDIKVTWDHTSSNTGPRDFKLAYSIDGTTFTDVAPGYSVLPNATPNSWTSGTALPIHTYFRDLSSVSSIENAATVYFRLISTSTVSANGGVVAAGGTSRVDNFTVEGTFIPEPSTYVLLGCGLALACWMRRK
ncbi:MAG: PEP-CTERM sorting domain-containing protein [Pirellulales bacterium]|nr:PEP-CTERM sorting domain-containing protein [Pirellulales bacterium]